MSFRMEEGVTVTLKLEISKELQFKGNIDIEREKELPISMVIGLIQMYLHKVLHNLEGGEINELGKFN